MRGVDFTQEELISYRTLEARIPNKHPLRRLRKVLDRLLASLDDVFDALYARCGRDSVPPERLLRARKRLTYSIFRLLLKYGK
jgi:hypothetical protein